MYTIDENILKNEEELENSSSCLEKWEEKTPVKIEKLINYIKVLENQNNFCADEVKRINEVKKINERKLENIKNFLIYLIGDKPLNIGTFRLSTRKSEIVEILDELSVPAEFLEKKETFMISKTKIKEFLNKDLINEETGEITKIEVPWARIKNNKSLIIK